MDRGFFPGGGFGGGFGRPFFRPFPHPFFPSRFLFPFFFFSPFFFPFFRDGNSNDMLFAQHQAQPGETLASVGHRYNMPHSILEEANPHLANPNQLTAGETVYVPRISNMMCQKTYSEMPAAMQQGQQMMSQGKQQ
ncbi:LysM peptidoglycan-binding domain-containing protein [Paenibacillus mendelii]|uniref:LysM domain-containing protein n=1 Tax=Paenibacillus mendelii TaxID=206163 RepID=A0ABV6JEU1_9BACL|nr:LysM domain-containing protein [Paenibacillus mendelii]MCQ6557307.1 LysM peptidoglycan-binding domain-containing protein [Paenibacillus mendelii]